MSQTVDDFLVKRLYDWGVGNIFGYPGDGINGGRKTLPQEYNCVTLADERGQYGLPVPRVTSSDCGNNKRLSAHSFRFMLHALQAVEAHDTCDENDDTLHLNGTARMSDDPRGSAVDADCRSWAMPNLWKCDGSVIPAVGGVNSTLTIQAIACRTADRIKATARRGEL